MFKLNRQVNTEGQFGFHKGSISRKAERLSQTIGNRSSGYFGTGFYFTVDGFLDSENQQNRERWIFDLSEYALIKGTRELHQSLRYLQSYIIFYPLSAVAEQMEEAQRILQELIYLDGNSWIPEDFYWLLINQSEYQQELQKFAKAIQPIEEDFFNTTFLYREFQQLLQIGKTLSFSDERDENFYEKVISFLNQRALNPKLIELWTGDKLHRIARVLGVSQEFLQNNVIPEVFDQLKKYYDPNYWGLYLYDSRDEEDSIPTRILKYLGYEGVYPTPERNDSFYGGVLFDLKDETYQEEEEKGNKVLRESQEKPPRYLYHATYKPFLKSILQKGLGNTRRKMWSDSEGKGNVYLAEDEEVAYSFAETAEWLETVEDYDKYADNIIVLKIDTSKLNPALFERDPNTEDQDTWLYRGIIFKEAFANPEFSTLRENQHNRLFKAIQSQSRYLRF